MLDGLNINLVKPSKRYQFTRYRLDVRARVGGVPKRIIETLQCTKQEAKERYYQLLAGLRAGGRIIPGPVKTFGELLTKYRENRGGEIPRSQRSVFNALARDLGNVHLRALPDALGRYSTLLQTSSSPRTGERLSGGSVNRHRAMIAAALNLGVELGLLEKSPLTKAIFPKRKETQRDRVLTPDEILRLLNVIEREAPHILAITQFSLQVPCRKSETVRMRREDWNELKNTICLKNGTTKSGRGCLKPIPPNMDDYFRAIPSASPWLFYREQDGQFFNLGDFKKAWARCVRLAGIVDFRFHDTRHVATTNFANAGLAGRQLQSIAGWASDEMAGRYYSPDNIKAANDARLLLGKAPWVLSGYALRDGTEKSGDYVANRAVI